MSCVESMKAFKRLYFKAVLNVTLFLMYLVASRLFHSRGSVYKGDFLNNSVRGFGSVKSSAFRRGLSPCIT